MDFFAINIIFFIEIYTIYTALLISLGLKVKNINLSTTFFVPTIVNTIVAKFVKKISCEISLEIRYNPIFAPAYTKDAGSITRTLKTKHAMKERWHNTDSTEYKTVLQMTMML